MKNKITNGLIEFNSFLESASQKIEEYSKKRERDRPIELEITKLSAIIKRNNAIKRHINSYNELLAKSEYTQKVIDDMSEDERKIFNKIFHDTPLLHDALNNKNDIFKIQKKLAV